MFSLVPELDPSPAVPLYSPVLVLPPVPELDSSPVEPSSTVPLYPPELVASPAVPSSSMLLYSTELVFSPVPPSVSVFSLFPVTELEFSPLTISLLLLSPLPISPSSVDSPPSTVVSTGGLHSSSVVLVPGSAITLSRNC